MSDSILAFEDEIQKLAMKPFRKLQDSCRRKFLINLKKKKKREKQIEMLKDNTVQCDSKRAKRQCEQHDSDDDFETPMPKGISVNKKEDQPHKQLSSSCQIVTKSKQSSAKTKKRKEPVNDNGSDDDFESPKKDNDIQSPKKRCKNGKRKVNNDRPHVYKDITTTRIRTRSCPANFCEMVQSLNVAQLAVVEEIGFSSVLQLDVHMVPTCLGYWLVTNYDVESNNLDIGTRKIEITRELVRDVLGIPMGDKQVVEMGKPSYSDPVIAEFRNQYGARSKLKKVKEVIETIKASDESGRIFKLNFLVVFNTIMGETTKGSTVLMRFLPSVTTDVDIKDLDWCSYIVTLLKNTKAGWSGLEHFNGPLTFLALVYAHEKGKSLMTTIPAIQHYGTVSLMYLEDDLFANTYTFLSHLEEAIRLKDEENVIDKEGVKNNEKEGCGTTITENEGSSSYEPYDLVSSPTNPTNENELRILIEKKVGQIDKLMTEVEGLMTEVEGLITRGIDKYPNDDGIKQVAVEWEINLQKYRDKKRDVSGNKVQNVTEINNQAGMSLSESTEEEIGFLTMEQLEKDAFMKIAILERKQTNQAKPSDKPSFDFMSQLTPLDEADYTNTPTRDGTAKHNDDVNVARLLKKMPILRTDDGFDEQEVVMETPPNQILAPLPISVVKQISKIKETRPTRNKTLPAILRSPFTRKKVSLATRWSKAEINISETIFAANKDVWNTVFETKHGIIVPRVSLETMYPGLMVHISVLDCWSAVLNSEDKFRNKKDPKRMFCYCNMLGDKDFDITVNEEERIKTFNTNMDRILRDTEKKTIIGFDLLFIPILYSKHYYVICFNLTQPQVHVIDNLASKADFDAKYGQRPQIMQKTLCSYLEIVGHPLASELKMCKPVRLEMPWRTHYNSVDCGIFVMRHMETYKCTPIKVWLCGLLKEVEGQRGQLNDLRVKYLVKILMSDINIQKDAIVAEVRQFAKVRDEEKEALKKSRFERIKERVESAI
ncbi:putative Ulp1 protease family catalytic domain, papain-like cysteine peptidase superfamily [Helianthus annuus]|uniref:uncharacterized protein LOC110872817 isoform X4 n=1 Tax=Helianthus annuus TaxID=4232 RepID=UPI000B906F64|nr:uncharacterized protein LOC110872817 isoform X4 [Helianthus annuus]XP_021993803.1 uncharacterized protein LOC110890496 isoform X4 [Helianthus annuus]KAJ0509294.1 putative Ulp1 protease family catalytic domain, papain-like cysteine peptidase superfamily [Helianthus annuus]KAJ0517399.1 putative Ulp1 protease family catalytic domain, papain-like cysteine peptidase superfamily [Helianthus annuus]KAJ0538755.1 putative Ulp1 protease family catalytic domain, papain-like cysteine peptidase superfami